MPLLHILGEEERALQPVHLGPQVEVMGKEEATTIDLETIMCQKVNQLLGHPTGTATEAATLEEAVEPTDKTEAEIDLGTGEVE